jgi:TetR/AcrR family transcriptional repressor of nem operon
MHAAVLSPRLKPEFDSARYHYFKAKDALARAVVELRLAQLQEWLSEADPYDRPEHRIKCLLRFVATGSEEIALHGCPFGTLSVELEGYDPRLGKVAKTLVTTQMERMKDQFGMMGKRPEREGSCVRVAELDAGRGHARACVR